MSETPNNEHALHAGTAFPWHELYVPDVAAATTFYTEALGFGHEVMPMGESGDYHMLTRNGKGVAGMMSTNDMAMEGVPPHWAVFFSVENVDTSVAKVVELGGSVVVEVMTVPTVGRMALIADPQGAHLWLFEDEKPD
jgi:predicted enzyme related to lactoylglutathione lyase